MSIFKPAFAVVGGAFSVLLKIIFFISLKTTKITSKIQIS
jgi:hypothetical protein